MHRPGLNQSLKSLKLRDFGNDQSASALRSRRNPDTRQALAAWMRWAACLQKHGSTKKEPRRRTDTCSDAGIFAAVSSRKEDEEPRLSFRFSCGQSRGIKVTAPGGGEFMPCKCLCVFTLEKLSAATWWCLLSLSNTRLLSGSHCGCYWNPPPWNHLRAPLFDVFVQ